jgi:hypothetical protein
MPSVAEEHRRALADALALADREIGELRARLRDAETRAETQRAARAGAEAREADARRALHDVTASLSWKATAPLRLAVARARELRAR